MGLGFGLGVRACVCVCVGGGSMWVVHVLAGGVCVQGHPFYYLFLITTTHPFYQPSMKRCPSMNWAGASPISAASVSQTLPAWTSRGSPLPSRSIAPTSPKYLEAALSPWLSFLSVTILKTALAARSSSSGVVLASEHACARASSIDSVAAVDLASCKRMTASSAVRVRGKNLSNALSEVGRGRAK